MRVLVMLDGTVADPDSPQIHVDDLGLMRGDGIFETVLVSGGQPRELDLHLARLATSAAKLDLPEPDLDTWRRRVADVIERWAEPECALKLVYTRGIEGSGEPTGFALGMSVSEKTQRQRETGVTAVTLERGIAPGLAERAPWLLLGAKSLSYGLNMAAGREAARRGADDVVFTASDGSVLEGPTSTVVLASGDTLRTTPTDIGILPGTTQAGLFRAAERAGWRCKTEPIGVDELFTADLVALVSSVRKVTRLHTLDGTALPDSSALHRQLCALYESEY